ncbi:MAG TPA: hypothetical protein DEO95_12810, partial [Ruminococcaceae bacterium]|nr:hypothetical protein [Oscillospiraceae bacterium]
MCLINAIFRVFNGCGGFLRFGCFRSFCTVTTVVFRVIRRVVSSAALSTIALRVLLGAVLRVVRVVR